MPSLSRFELERVRRNTSPDVNRQIDEQTASNIRDYADQSRDVLSRRIAELQTEWDIERVLETNASILALSGLALGVTVNRKWLALSGTVLGFLLLHGLDGWCPPVPVLRRLGVRTRSEIDAEIFALRQLRGDFDDVHRGTRRELRKLAAAN